MPSRFFPPASRATSEGLVFVGGRLTTARLLDAYRYGIFPWPSNAYEPMLWWSPDPRAILPLDGLHISRRLQRNLSSGKFTITFSTAFTAVIQNCTQVVGERGELG